MMETERGCLGLEAGAAAPQQERSGRVPNLLRKLAWYRSRLAAMSVAEIGHRVEEQAKRAASRWHQPDFALLAGDGPLPTLPGLADGVSALAARPGVADGWRSLAARAARGRFHALGVDWPDHDRSVRWHLDPVTGRSWPDDRYCFDISYRHTGGLGDIKCVWEVNRLQHLPPMAALATVTGDAELAADCAAEIASWIDANPPFLGVNWASGIELSLRAISLIATLSLLPPETLSAPLRAHIRATLAAHGYWLMRYPSRFSSANNHLVAEAAGLYLIGALTPGLRDGKRWARHGRRVLLEECARQIHPDGVGAEQSPTYTAFTLEFLMLAGCVAERTGDPFPPSFWARIEAAGEWLRWLTDRSGNLPRIGDDDEGRVFISDDGPEPYVGSILAAIAALRDRPELAPPRVTPHLRHALFGLAPPSAACPPGVRHFEDGGYTVVRGGPSLRDSLLVFDHGPLGYLSIAAHGHADTLAVWLHVDGRPVLADAGTYLYHSGGDHRTYLRGTRAHNTLCLDGADSSRISGPFNWSSKANATVTDLQVGGQGGAVAVEAEHDGYAQRAGARHRRRVEQCRDTITITDRLVGALRPLPVEIGFLLHPGVTATRDDAGWLVCDGDGPLVRISGGDPLEGSAATGAESAQGGWHSPAFGTLQPATRLCFRGSMDGDTACRFTITILGVADGKEEDTP